MRRRVRARSQTLRPAVGSRRHQQCRDAGVPFYAKQGSGVRPDVPLLIPGQEIRQCPRPVGADPRACPPHTPRQLAIAGLADDGDLRRFVVAETLVYRRTVYATTATETQRLYEAGRPHALPAPTRRHLSNRALRVPHHRKGPG